MTLSYNLYCFSSSTTQRFHTLAYIMISSSPSHLLKLSVAQGIAQSTLLARHHSVACFVLSSPRNVLTPQQASLGGLHENI